MVSKWLEKGLLTISDDVIALIAALTVQDIEGVADFVSNLRSDFNRVVNNRGGKRGVFVQISEDEAIITIKLAVHYGVKVADVCRNVQEAVKQEIEMMTGVTVREVNVSVEQVKFDKKMLSN